MATFSHGLNAVVKLHDGTALRDLSSAGTSCSLDLSKDTVETTAFGSTSKTYVGGLRDATFTIEGARDATIEGYVYTSFLQSASVAWEYYPEGTASGKVKYTGNVILTKGPGPSASTDDTVKWSAEAQVTGDVTKSLVP